jgi:hypothetical protein
MAYARSRLGQSVAGAESSMRSTSARLRILPADPPFGQCDARVEFLGRPVAEPDAHANPGSPASRMQPRPPRARGVHQTGSRGLADVSRPPLARVAPRGTAGGPDHAETGCFGELSIEHVDVFLG